MNIIAEVSKTEDARPPEPKRAGFFVFSRLDTTATTQEANAVIDALTEEVKATEEPKKGRGKRRSTERIRRAIEAFLGDLLTAHKLGGPCVRSLRSKSFNDQEIGRSAFLFVVEALKDLGYIEHKLGRPFLTTSAFGKGPVYAVRGEPGTQSDFGKASEFNATEKLLALCGSVHAAHFVKPFPEFPVELRKASTRRGGNKQRGASMPFNREDPDVQRIATQVSEMNEFLGGFEMLPYRFSGLVRKFAEGDQPDFRWNKGGRLYAHGSLTYQTLKKEERKVLTIAGEETVEADVRASFIAIFHGLMDQPFDPANDPYELPGLPREVGKAWTTATFGCKKPVTKWPTDVVAEYLEDHGRDLNELASAKDVRDAMVERFPLFKRWGKQGPRGGPPLTWADLQFRESEAILQAMTILKAQNKPAFPIHDCLLVRRSDVEDAKAALRTSYFAHFEVSVLAR